MLFISRVAVVIWMCWVCFDLVNLTLGLLWPFALVWAFTRPGAPSASEEELRREVRSLASRLAALEERGDGSGQP